MGTRKELVAAIVEQARRSSTRSVMMHAAIAERLGLHPTDHKCADLVFSEAGEFTPGRIAELTGLSTGAVTGVIDRLERAGFVERMPDPHDRRRTIVRSTPERMPNMKRIFEPLSSGVERVCAKYTVGELILVLRFLQEMSQMAQQATEEVRAAVAAETRSR